MLASTAVAGDCRIVTQTVIGHNVVTSTGSVIVPYAVPVATPVALAVNGYAYQAAQPQQVDPAEWAAFQQWKRSQGSVNALGASLVQQNCIKCHTAGGDGFDHFDMTKPLTAEMKLAAIAAISEGSMPKGKTIDPQVRGDLVGELSGAKPQGEKP